MCRIPSGHPVKENLPQITQMSADGGRQPLQFVLAPHLTLRLCVASLRCATAYGVRKEFFLCFLARLKPCPDTCMAGGHNIC